jgi:hypothetical protein
MILAERWKLRIPPSFDFSATGLPVANAHLTCGDARKAVLKSPHSRRWRDHLASPHRAKRLDCGAFTATFSLVVHRKMILGSTSSLIRPAATLLPR